VDMLGRVLEAEAPQAHQVGPDVAGCDVADVVHPLLGQGLEAVGSRLGVDDAHAAI